MSTSSSLTTPPRSRPAGLPRLVETFLDLTDVGLAVPKVLRPDGRLKHTGRPSA